MEDICLNKEKKIINKFKNYLIDYINLHQHAAGFHVAKRENAIETLLALLEIELNIESEEEACQQQ